MSSGFITEKEIEEKKRLRQEEWDKVRNPEDPLEAPLPAEQLPDRRSLFERLQEQKNKKQEEFEEAHKLKNLVRGLDDDESDFLDHVDKLRMDEERRKRMEEAQELSEFRSKVSELREQQIEVLIKQEIGLIKPDNKKAVFLDAHLPSIGVGKTSQTKLLAGLVKRKSQIETPSSTEQTSPPEKKARQDSTSATTTSPDNKAVSADKSTSEIASVPYKGNLVCIGVLPGLASYTNSSSENDSDSTSDSEHTSPHVARDLCGRRIVTEQQTEGHDKKK